jgi:hypothetical protein
MVQHRSAPLMSCRGSRRKPTMLLDEDPRRWDHTEGTLEAVARTFADEIAICGSPSTVSAIRYKARWMGKS